jgi:hypothetical protein
MGTRTATIRRFAILSVYESKYEYGEWYLISHNYDECDELMARSSHSHHCKKNGRVE